MYKASAIGIGFLLLALGLALPVWYFAVAGVAVLSLMLPFVGVPLGFFLDILYGAPSVLPAWIAFPCTIGACILGIISLFIRTYLR